MAIDILEIQQLFVKATKFCKSSNYYFQMHQCPSQGQDIKVNMDYSIKKQGTQEIIRFGCCPHCGSVFYNEDFEK